MDEFRWTGREGEKSFSLLCSRKKVTCNKAEEDDRGWDYIVHFPAPSIIKVPIDQRPTGPAALVQIKATRVDATRWAISLKNALSLAKSPLPAFIVCVGLNAEGIDSFRAIHIWRDEMARILKAGRQAYVEGDEATNRRTVTFEIDERASRPDLIGWMTSEIERIGETVYAAAKQRLVDTLGFEDGHGKLQMQLSLSSRDAFADLQLGILKSLEIDHLSYTPSRFGIEGPAASIEMEGATLALIPKGRTGTLRLRSAAGDQEFLPAQIFSAALPGRRRTKARVKAGCIEVILKPRGAYSVKGTLDPDEVTSLANIGAFALLRQSTRAKPLLIGLRTEASFEDFGHVNMKSNPDPGWQQLHFISEALRRLVAFENAEPILTSLEAINAAFVPLSVLDALVASRTMRLEFTPVKEVEGTIGAFLAYTQVKFGGLEIGAVASRTIVSDEMIGSIRRIHMGPATILHAAVNDGRAASMFELYMDELDRMSDGIDVLAIGDLHRSVSTDKERPLIVDEPRRLPMRRLMSRAPDDRAAGSR